MGDLSSRYHVPYSLPLAPPFRHTFVYTNQKRSGNTFLPIIMLQRVPPKGFGSAEYDTTYIHYLSIPMYSIS